MAIERGVEVDDGEFQLGGGLLDEGDDLIVDDGVVDAVVAGAHDGDGVAEVDLGLGVGFSEGFDEGLGARGKASFVRPVLGLTVVGAELDDDDVGGEVHGIGEGLLFFVRLIAVVQHGGAAVPVVLHVIAIAQQVTELSGIAVLRVFHTCSSGDAIAHAGDFDFGSIG